MQESKVLHFDIKDLLPIGITIVVLGIGLSYGLDIMGDMKEDIGDEATLSNCCNHSGNGGDGSIYDCCGAQYNASLKAIEGVAKIPDKMPMVVTVVIAAIIIGILVRYLMVR